MSVYELILNNTAFGIAESVVRWPSGMARYILIFLNEFYFCS